MKQAPLHFNYDYDQGEMKCVLFICRITYYQSYISEPSENVMKFVALHICSLLNISLKYMKQLPLYFL